MKLLTFRTTAGEQIGILKDRRVYETGLSAETFYRQGLDALPRLANMDFADQANHLESELRLAPLVPAPGKIICAGLNYRRHALEAGMEVPAQPILFNKYNNALAAAGQPIGISPAWKQVDYEAELGLVIGKRAKNVPEAEAGDYVLGYCCANDVSERALQFRSSQWMLGKTLDGFLPLGPYLVTADEVGDPQDLSIRGWLNGELRQDSSTADMIFSVAEIIAYASRYMTLAPGDVIVTGTPEGVIQGLADQIYIQPGDRYRVEIEKLGRLENSFVEA